MLQQQFADAFNHYAAEGVKPLEVGGDAPHLSHVCFKFESLDAYTAAVADARTLGVVTQEIFKGKEITWCRLHQPLEKDGLRLDWLELVEPRVEAHPFNGVANIGYSLPALTGAVKHVSADGKMSFRYQAQHAIEMAPRP